jgi:LPS O-antigen subunit length determinant protein (WzzB/FepE family)
MRGWLRTRGRALLSFLSDVGGALAFSVFAVGLIVAAITGTVLLLVDAFPQPFFTLLVLGMALLAAGLALHFLREPLAPSKATVPPPSAHPASDNPYSRAAALQRQHEDDKAKTEARNRLLEERRAIRRVREELLDNKHVLSRIPGDLDELLSLK